MQPLQIGGTALLLAVAKGEKMHELKVIRILHACARVDLVWIGGWVQVQLHALQPPGILVSILGGA